MSDNMKSWCDGLRDLADFVESYRDSDDYTATFTLNLFVDDAEDLAEKGRRLGACHKHESGGYYFLQKDFGPHNIALNILRDKVCARVQVGTTTVMKPDPEATLIAVEEPVYEWTCPDSVLAVANTDSEV